MEDLEYELSTQEVLKVWISHEDELQVFKKKQAGTSARLYQSGHKDHMLTFPPFRAETAMDTTPTTPSDFLAACAPDAGQDVINSKESKCHRSSSGKQSAAKRPKIVNDDIQVVAELPLPSATTSKCPAPTIEVVKQPTNTYGIILSRGDRKNRHGEFVEVKVSNFPPHCALRLEARTRDHEFILLKGTDECVQTTNGGDICHFKWTKLSISTNRKLQSCYLKFILSDTLGQSLAEAHSMPFDVTSRFSHAAICNSEPVQIGRVIPRHLPSTPGSSIFIEVVGPIDATWISRIVIGNRQINVPFQTIQGAGGVFLTLPSGDIDYTITQPLTIISGNARRPNKNTIQLKPDNGDDESVIIIDESDSEDGLYDSKNGVLV